MNLLENWPIKVAILVILLFVAGGAYYAYKIGEHMALEQQMIPILTEKYRAPTEEAWKKAHAEMNIPYTEGHRFTSEQIKAYVAKWERQKQDRAGAPGGAAPVGSSTGVGR